MINKITLARHSQRVKWVQQNKNAKKKVAEHLLHAVATKDDERYARIMTNVHMIGKYT